MGGEGEGGRGGDGVFGSAGGAGDAVEGGVGGWGHFEGEDGDVVFWEDQGGDLWTEEEEDGIGSELGAS